MLKYIRKTEHISEIWIWSNVLKHQSDVTTDTNVKFEAAVTPVFYIAFQGSFYDVEDVIVHPNVLLNTIMLV